MRVARLAKQSELQTDFAVDGSGGPVELLRLQEETGFSGDVPGNRPGHLPGIWATPAGSSRQRLALLLVTPAKQEQIVRAALVLSGLVLAVELKLLTAEGLDHFAVLPGTAKALGLSVPRSLGFC